MLFRTAEVKGPPMNDFDAEFLFEDDLDSQFRVMFDLSKRYDKEYIPAAAERVLWASMNAKSKGASYLPHF